MIPGRIRLVIGKGLAIAGVSWFKWARFLLPLIIVQYVIGAIFVLVVHLFIGTVS